jgi:hypothetical protein
MNARHLKIHKAEMRTTSPAKSNASVAVGQIYLDAEQEIQIQKI